MQLTMTIFPGSAVFIEKKRVENRLWAKRIFLWQKKCIMGSGYSGPVSAAFNFALVGLQ